MAKLQKRTKMKTAAAVIAGCIILGGTGTAYAANVGGIQRTVQIWLHGDQTQATLDVSNNILPLGSVVFVMFCVSKYGWGWKRFIKEADTGEGLKFPANVQKYMLYVIPAIVVVIYLKGYYDMFSPKGPVVLTVWMIVSLLVLGLVGWIIFGKNKTKE